MQIRNAVIGSAHIQDASITRAHIAEALIDVLNVNALNAVTAKIKELAAGAITADELYTSIAMIATAQITTANIVNANIDWVQQKLFSFWFPSDSATAFSFTAFWIAAVICWVMTLVFKLRGADFKPWLSRKGEFTLCAELITLSALRRAEQYRGYRTYYSTYGRALLQIFTTLASKYGVVLAEDDPYRDLRYAGEPLPAIKSFDEDGWVVFWGSFSELIRRACV